MIKKIFAVIGIVTVILGGGYLLFRDTRDQSLRGKDCAQFPAGSRQFYECESLQ